MTQAQKRFERRLIYFDVDTQNANFRGNPLCQATTRHTHISSDHTTGKRLKTMKTEREKTYLFWVEF